MNKLIDYIEEGTKVYSPFYGWGRVIDIDFSYSNPIEVSFDKKVNDLEEEYYPIESYTIDGKTDYSNLQPSLFLEEVKYPKQKLFKNEKKHL